MGEPPRHGAHATLWALATPSSVTLGGLLNSNNIGPPVLSVKGESGIVLIKFLC